MPEQYNNKKVVENLSAMIEHWQLTTGELLDDSFQ
jgi:hypothetical protein